MSKMFILDMLSILLDRRARILFGGSAQRSHRTSLSCSRIFALVKFRIEKLPISAHQLRSVFQMLSFREAGFQLPVVIPLETVGKLASVDYDRITKKK